MTTPPSARPPLHAVILAGGKGTRLRPFTVTIPKPLLPLGDTPVLEIVLAQLAHAGFERIAVTLNHMASIFGAQLGDGSRWNVLLDYFLETEPLGTAGSLRLVTGLPETFLVMNGDLLTTLPFAKAVDEHRASGCMATIVTHPRQVQIDYGVIETNAAGELAGYREKPTIDYSVSTGMYILNREALDYMPLTGKFDMPELMLALIAAGHRVGCRPTDCYWQDIGRFEDYQRASEDYVANPSRFHPERAQNA